MDFHQSDIALHHHHVSYIADFHCHYPQPRVVRLKDLLTQHQTHGKAYFPDITVLHHCDDGCGSCPSEQSCGPLHSDFIRLPFKVTFLEDFGFHKKGSWGWEYHDVSNHTVCSCYTWGSEGRGGSATLHHKTVYDTEASDILGNRMGGDEDVTTEVSTTTTAKTEENSLKFPE